MKQIYLDEVERLTAELIEWGVEPGKACDLACEQLHDSVSERLADYADDIKTRGKE